MLAEVAKLQNFYRYTVAYLSKNNPFIMFLNTVIVNWTELVSQNKKLKVAKYRVNHLKYRLYQMEQVIDQGNPYNIAEGQKLDRIL